MLSKFIFFVCVIACIIGGVFSEEYPDVVNNFYRERAINIGSVVRQGSITVRSAGPAGDADNCRIWPSEVLKV